MPDVRPAVFLDRDGVINKDFGYVYRIKDFEYIDGAIEGMRELSELGYNLVIVTNQSGIARGIYTEEDYRNLTAWMLDDMSKKGVRIAGDYFCPHHPNGKIKRYAKVCDCRKPKAALFYRAARELSICFEGSFVIGDRSRDLSICNESPMMGILFGITNETVDGMYKYCKTWEEIVEFIRDRRCQNI